MSLPDPVLEFIRKYVDSIETMEILLLLQRAPDTFWTAAAINSHFGMKQGIAEKRLQVLAQNGFITQGMTGGYRYTPRDEGLRADVSALAAAYADHRSTLANAIFSENLGRLRAFADAFKVKKE
jgi:hypothetical protein